jgi:hypothetical protein
MSRGIKPHKVHARQLEEVREPDPDGRIMVAPPHRRHARQDAQGRDDFARDARCREGLPAGAYHRQPRPAARTSDPPGSGNGSRPGSERPPAPRLAPRAQGDAGAGRHLEPSGLVRVAHHRSAAERPRVGDATRLGRPAGAAGAGARDSGGGPRDAGRLRLPESRRRISEHTS